MITIARIDERLIHGQVGYAWSVVYKSDAIMVIDNEISKDKFQISLLQMACPAGVKCFVCDEDKAVELLNKYAKKKIFVVVKHPGTLLHIYEKGVKLEKINVGGLYFKEGRPISAEAISSAKAALMGPLSSIGDSVFKATFMTIFAAIGAALALDGNPMGPVIFIVPNVLLNVCSRWLFIKYGYA